ncbi:MAG: hypothetical protein R3F20_13470 [Planctomycetota bacterium]
MADHELKGQSEGVAAGPQSWSALPTLVDGESKVTGARSSRTT